MYYQIMCVPLREFSETVSKSVPYNPGLCVRVKIIDDIFQIRNLDEMDVIILR